MKRPIIIFALVYFLLEIVTIFIIFGWNAFGGSDHKSSFQNIIEFVFRFPSKWLFKNSDSILLNIVPNTIFWTLVFAIVYYLWRRLR